MVSNSITAAFKYGMLVSNIKLQPLFSADERCRDSVFAGFQSPSTSDLSHFYVFLRLYERICQALNSS